MPESVDLPDLAFLRNRAMATYLLRAGEGRQLPRGIPSTIAGNFVRCLGVAVGAYERGRELVDEGIDKGEAWSVVRGSGELEVAVVWAHRATSLAVSLCRFPATSLPMAWLPSDPERELLRRMRNAVVHIDEAILCDYTKPGHMVALFLDAEDLFIDDVEGEARMSQRGFADTLRHLNTFGNALADHPERWTRRRP
jgi:hypothetical protein